MPPDVQRRVCKRMSRMAHKRCRPLPTQAKSWELRAVMSMARLWRDQSKCQQAQDLLGPIYGWLTEGLDTPVLQDAKALLDQLGYNS